MDRSYLFGILAVQLGFSRPEAVMGAASAWLTDPSRTVADRLVINGDLTEQQRGLLDGIVDQSIRAHGELLTG